MKPINYFIATFLLMIGTSCSDFLEKTPLTDLSSEYFWNTEQDLRIGLNKLYDNMENNMDYTLDCQTSDCFANTGNDVSSGTYTPPNKDGVWTACYESIRICNDVLENYEGAKVTDEVKNRYSGEARFFRAYFYYQLVKRFGDVPLVDHTLGLNDDILKESRTPKVQVWNFIIEDLEFAAANIPAKSKIMNDLGRVTSGTAQSFLARIALYAGTYYKFSGEGDGNDFLKIAQEAAKAVIDSKEYSLYSDYRNLFLFPGNESCEDILAYHYAEEKGNMNEQTRKTIYDCDCEPTKYLADAFLGKDGLPIEKSAYAPQYLPLGTEFENRDPRMALTLWKPGDDFSGEPFVPNLANQTRTGYMFKKYGSEGAYNYVPACIYINKKLIRYAEVLLTYAEATYELNGSISDDDLNISINLLRDRFADDPNHLPHLTNAFVQTHGLNMRTELRRERRVEFAAEGMHYDDIIRWRTAESELTRPILGAKFDTTAYPNVNPGTDIILDENGFILSQNAGSRFFDTSKDYLFPLPIREISLNSNLKQNPGW
ncbi:MAG: RagB/SusD family nutrient uptake outer membrane protein [Massilibacteroides sp.]|nr:RagB/SusD family nutrient uptake outer membrane protein [Massilibacteroides sp.]